MAPAGLAYSTPAPVYEAGIAITPDYPIISPLGGAPTNYSVTPDLSQIGLTLDPTSGVVSGTPAALSSPTAPPLTATYTVTASNSAGTVTAPLTITIYNSHQSVPNMAQAIDPLAAPGSSFQFLDTGMVVTDTYNPNVAPVEWMAGQAVSTAVNPNLNLLAVLTSGFNRVFHEAFPFFDPLYSNEYVFLYDISGGTPVFKQAIPIPNAYHGLAWDPVTGNNALYVSGGMGDAPFGTDPIPYTVNGTPLPITETMFTSLPCSRTEAGRPRRSWTWARAIQWSVDTRPATACPCPTINSLRSTARSLWLPWPPEWRSRTMARRWSWPIITTTRSPYSPEA